MAEDGKLFDRKTVRSRTLLGAGLVVFALVTAACASGGDKDASSAAPEHTASIVLESIPSSPEISAASGGTNQVSNIALSAKGALAQLASQIQTPYHSSASTEEIYTNLQLGPQAIEQMDCRVIPVRTMPLDHDISKGVQITAHGNLGNLGLQVHAEGNSLDSYRQIAASNYAQGTPPEAWNTTGLSDELHSYLATIEGANFNGIVQFAINNIDTRGSFIDFGSVAIEDEALVIQAATCLVG